MLYPEVPIKIKSGWQTKRDEYASLPKTRMTYQPFETSLFTQIWKKMGCQELGLGLMNQMHSIASLMIALERVTLASTRKKKGRASKRYAV